MANRDWSERELEIIAKRIRMVRKMLGLKQIEFAEQIGVSRSYVSKVERGAMRASHKLVHRIETAYGVELTENIDDDNWVPGADLSLKMDWSKIKCNKKKNKQKAMPPITQRIFELLQRKDIMQRELADSIGITRASVSAWKQQNSLPSADKIMPICRALNVTPYFLLEGKEEGVPYPAEMM